MENVHWTAVLMLCPADVLSEDAILKWYSDGKGKGILLEQLKPFVEWLKQAEEGACLVPCLILSRFYARQQELL